MNGCFFCILPETFYTKTKNTVHIVRISVNVCIKSLSKACFLLLSNKHIYDRFLLCGRSGTASNGQLNETISTVWQDVEGAVGIDD